VLRSRADASLRVTFVIDDDKVLARVRKLLLMLLAGGSLGTGVELLLLGHFEEFTQLVPLVLLAAGLVTAAWHLASTDASVAALRWLMAVFVASGGLGVVLHYRGNVEFEREMYPALAGMELIGKTLTGATPVFAPGTMALLGAIGLLASYGLRTGE
jgi:hypothetical protein